MHQEGEDDAASSTPVSFSLSAYLSMGLSIHRTPTVLAAGNWPQQSQLTDKGDAVGGRGLEDAAGIGVAQYLEGTRFSCHQQHSGSYVSHIFQGPCRRNQGRIPPALRVGGQEVLCVRMRER